jgi:hypothetical protein
LDEKQMSYWARVWQGIIGQAKKRLPKQLEVLGAPAELVLKARKASEEEQETLFLEFTEGRCAITLDWKATAADLVEGLGPLLSESAEQLPENVEAAIAALRSRFAVGPRTLVHTETLGDFSILVLVPNEKAQEFIACVGPWRIL